MALIPKNVTVRQKNFDITIILIFGSLPDSFTPSAKPYGRYAKTNMIPYSNDGVLCKFTYLRSKAETNPATMPMPADPKNIKQNRPTDVINASPPDITWNSGLFNSMTVLEKINS